MEPETRYAKSGGLRIAYQVIGEGRQRDQCAIPLSDANLGIARLDMAAGPLGAAWFQMTGLEQALDDPAAVGG